jgi:hypothetical protein
MAAEYVGGIQDRVKTSSSTIGLWVAKVFVSLFLGLTLALIGDEVLQYGWFSFILMLVTFTAVLIRVMRAWTWGYVAIFTLICVLIGLLLRMYILIAPG